MPMKECDSSVALNSILPAGESLLVVAHPGHELLVHGWLETAAPAVVVLTDGSGGQGESRLASSERTIRTAGGMLSGMFGECTDREVYGAILSRNLDYVRRLLDRLTDVLLDTKPSSVVGDASEGYNPTHDLCRALIDASVRRGRSAGLEITSYDFPLIHPHLVPNDESEAIVLELNEAQLSRKIRAAQQYPELADELEAVITGRREVVLRDNSELARLADSRIENIGDRNLALECLSPAGEHGMIESGETPFYELYGEYLASIGRYSEVIRYGDHMIPILDVLGSESR